MKAMIKALLGLVLVSAASAVTLPAWSQSVDDFQRLVRQPDYRQRQHSRIREELRRWRNGAQAPAERLWQETRAHFNLNPRDPELRGALLRMLQQRHAARALSPQAEELYYYQLLNLEPRNSVYRDKLAALLLQKHGGHSPAEVRQAYQRLNDALNTWDKRQYDRALQLFRQARLPRSAELTAIVAAHLRDRGHFDEAHKLLSSFAGDRSYLNWIDESLKALQASQRIVNSSFAESDKLMARIQLGHLSQAEMAIKAQPDGPMKHWYQAKWLEKQASYHSAAAEYRAYYQQRWSQQMPGFVPVVYKAQLEDVNSLDLIALKFRTSPELIRQVNEAWPHDWVETYRMLIVPVPRREMAWPTTGYVSSHFGYRLHPIRGTWRLHEGLDIETLKGVKATAPLPGKVMQAGYDSGCGNLIRLQHADPALRTVFCHGERLLQRQGAQLQQGQDVLVTGTTGASASIHLHFGVQLNGVYSDPMDWL